jgi:hypothetical protein
MPLCHSICNRTHRNSDALDGDIPRLVLVIWVADDRHRISLDIHGHVSDAGSPAAMFGAGIIFPGDAA